MCSRASSVEQKKIFRAKNLPLDYMDKFVDVRRFISGGGSPLQEVGVLVRDSADRLILEVGKLAGFFLPKEVLSEVFRGKFTDALRVLFRPEETRLPRLAVLAGGA